jgi:ATP-dependent Clp endopeptidase proteolytic subunit ClpP
MVQSLTLVCLLGLAAAARAFITPAALPRHAAGTRAAAQQRLSMAVEGGYLNMPFDPLAPAYDQHLDLISQVNNNGPQMISGGASSGERRYDGARIGPPPDLPSLLLHNRIVYLGMPLVPAVTELIIAELLYLNFESSTKPIYMYINTPGTSTPDGRSVGFETEAFAIADCMRYVKPPVYTIAVGQAFGTGAMLLSQGAKGNRAALPNASIMLHQPRSQARGQASDIAIKAREVSMLSSNSTNLLYCYVPCYYSSNAVALGLKSAVATNEKTLKLIEAYRDLCKAFSVADSVLSIC